VPREKYHNRESRFSERDTFNPKLLTLRKTFKLSRYMYVSHGSQKECVVK